MFIVGRLFAGAGAWGYLVVGMWPSDSYLTHHGGTLLTPASTILQCRAGPSRSSWVLGRLERNQLGDRLCPRLIHGPRISLCEEPGSSMARSVGNCSSLPRHHVGHLLRRSGVTTLPLDAGQS